LTDTSQVFFWTTYPAGYTWPGVPLIQDHSGEWWLGAKTLVRLGRIPLQQIPAARPEAVYGSQGELRGLEVFKMFEDSLGGIWVSLTKGKNRVARWDVHGGLRMLPPTNGPVEQLVSAFAEDHAGDIWMGLYGNGVVRYRNGAFTQFGAQDGVPAGFVSSLYVDDAGRLWIGSSYGGLGRVDSPAAEHPTVRIYDASHGLTSDEVTSITADQWGRIYAGTGRGIDRLDPATDRVIHYTTQMLITDGTVRLKSLPARRSPALRMALLTLFAVGAAQAAVTFNAPNSANAQTLPSYIDFDDNNCPSNPIANPTGTVTNGGQGLSLSGSGSIQGYGELASCYMTMYWQGTGSGTFGSTATITPSFTVTIPSDVTITCTVTVYINGTQQAQYNCTRPPLAERTALRRRTFPCRPL
jgi:hypothetical protein